MRKRMTLFLVLLTLTAVSLLAIAPQNKKVRLSRGEDGQLSVEISTGLGKKTVNSWEKEGKKYFFLPAFIDHNIYMGAKEIYVDGTKYRKGEMFVWEEDSVYRIDEDTVVFVKSENLPTIFIETDSGSIDTIEDKSDWMSTGSIDVILSDGRVEYSGGLERISLRGNSTRRYPKKPYAIKLKDARALCGMSRLKRWNLLAGWREGCKMSNKIAYDIAEALELENSVSSTWVNLYLNGEYNGIYLLCEAISVGENGIPIYDLEKENEAVNRNLEMAKTCESENMKWYDINDGEDITGGYLIEKEYLPYYERQENGFITEYGHPFMIKEPSHASRQQAAYIKEQVDRVERLLLEGDQEYREFLDIDSFTKKFLVDEIALNRDIGVTSMFLYKERGDDRLYGGPVWDYDSAFGSGNPFPNSPWDSYDTSALENKSEGLILWYRMMYEDEVFYNTMRENYWKVLPYMEELIDTGIDEYAAYIGPSVKMDEIRWKDREDETDILNAGHYRSFEANVKYMKYFLVNRVNFLNDRWEIEYKELTVPAGTERHKVVFAEDGKETVCWTADGETLGELPSFDEQKYEGWYFTYSNEVYFDKLPIYEDVTFCCRVRQ